LTLPLLLLLQTFLSQRGKGAVVAISSLSHKIGAFAAPYGAEKAKINALCSFLHHELKGSGVTAQAMVLGAVVTPGLTAFMGPRKPAAAADNAAASGNSSSDNAAGSSSSGSSSGSSSAAIIKPTLTMPSAEAAAAAIVRNIGRGGPVVTPFWGHALSEVLLLDGWWPPELQRAVVGRIAR
jgi:short-subunit dehydrogenase